MSDSFKVLRYEESERLDESSSNWNFWKTRIVPYLKGMRLWGHISGTMARPPDSDIKGLTQWEEPDAQAPSIILMNIVPNIQAGLDCSSSKAAWDGLLSRYAQADPIAQNFAYTWLLAKCYLEGGPETMPTHLAELQRLREACGGLGLIIADPQFAGIITLSMPPPSWDPVMGMLGGVLDPMVIISRLNTEWSRWGGLTSDKKNPNIVFQTGAKSSYKCDNCGKTGHSKTRCWAKGGGLEGQYPEWFKGKRDSNSPNVVKTLTDSAIVWTCGSGSQLDMWIADSAA